MTETRIVVSHAGGLVAEALLEKLSTSGYSAEQITLLDIDQRVGVRHAFGKTYLAAHSHDDFDFAGCRILLMTESDADLYERARAQGTFIVSHAIESSSPACYYAPGFDHPDIPFNASELRLVGAEAACLLPALTAIQSIATIKQVNLNFLKSVEFEGRAGVDELASQTVNLLNSKDVNSSAFEQQIAFNMLTEHENGNVEADLAGLLKLKQGAIFQQSAIIPLFHGIAISVQLIVETALDPVELEKQLSEIPKVKLETRSISPISDCNQSFSCAISHLKQGANSPSAVQFWLIADPMRYGLANNYVNVTEFLLKSFL
ncbi:MAG: aspartate-semialdehyde dehydrogenase [Planctomycetota bacterium]|jgi:aspartate-semialdehyde dehydrogenase